jgi:hypothetical protein
MASCVPAGTVALAGLDLDQLRASPLYPKLPRAAVVFLEPFRDARSLLAAFSGKDLLVVAGGSFAQAPAGATLASPRLALAGSPEAVRAAETQHGTRVTGAPELLAQAQRIAAGNQIWIAVRGDVMLPLTGNAANLNHMLRNLEFADLTLRVQSTLEFAIVARGRTQDAARHFADTLRASLTMAAAAEAKQADLAALLRSIRVRREDRSVRASVSTTADMAQKLIQRLVEP